MSTWLERLGASLSGEPQDKEALIKLLRDAENRKLLSTEVLSMLEGVMQVSEMQARDIMIPRLQMTVIKADLPLEEIMPIIIDSGHSRFPVIGETRDEVLGILLAKDVLKCYHQHRELSFNVGDIVRPATFVPESKRLDSLLKDFRRTHNHLAIVADEYGGIAGLVTIEDVLEQIVGDIEDEFDPTEEAFIKKLSESEFTLDAQTPIEDFNEYFHAQLSEEEFDTIGGLVLKELGHLPKRDEQAQIGEFQFTVLNADNRRIKLLRMTKG
jgi:magnesium and cobalt transporter